MPHPAVVPAGARRPGPRSPRVAGDGGAVTVEAALALLGLTAVLVAVLWCLGLLASQLALGEAARAAARVAARGDSTGDVAHEVHRLVPEASVSVTADGSHLVVDLRREVRPPGLLDRFGPVRLTARAVAADEAAP